MNIATDELAVGQSGRVAFPGRVRGGELGETLGIGATEAAEIAGEG